MQTVTSAVQKGTEIHELSCDLLLNLQQWISTIAGRRDKEDNVDRILFLRETLISNIKEIPSTFSFPFACSAFLKRSKMLFNKNEHNACKYNNCWTEGWTRSVSIEHFHNVRSSHIQWIGTISKRGSQFAHTRQHCPGADRRGSIGSGSILSESIAWMHRFF